MWADLQRAVQRRYIILFQRIENVLAKNKREKTLPCQEMLIDLTQKVCKRCVSLGVYTQLGYEIFPFFT